ncbi:alpha/beta hydrolase [Nocardiopsis sp. NPDC049922]|uniref:alpha/beta fold hydrolase n=1 Tax=Nocardiopsis sp. NPDC049922 TaxID=3155157 RepID=UPI0033E47C79
MTPTTPPLITGSGPGLLLAHGAGSDVQDSFGPLLPALAERYTVVGADYPGSGAQPPTDDALSLDLLADRVVGSADEAGLGTFAVVGFSMGTAVAVRAATRHPDRVRALVLSAGLAAPSPRLRLAVDTWRALERSENPEVLAAYLSLLVNSRAWLDGRSHEQIRAQISRFQEAVPTGSGAQLELLRGVDVRGDLAHVTVPTLVVSPTDDLLVSPGHSRELLAGIDGARLVELDCGHAVADECAREWTDAITGFLDTVPLDAADR